MVALTRLSERLGLTASARSSRPVSLTSFMLTLARFGGAGLGVVMQILVARLYGADTLGHFFLAFGITSVLSILLSVGFPWIIAVVVARAEASGDAGLLRHFMGVAYRHLALACGVLALPAAAAIWLYPDIPAPLRAALLLGIATAPIYSLMRLYGGLANARRQFVLANAPELLLRPLFLLVVVGAAVLVSLPLEAAHIVGANLLVTGLLTGGMYWLLRRARRPDATGSEVARRDAGQAREWRNLAMPMIVAALFVNVFADVDILLVGMLAPAEKAGIFGACIKITMLFAFAVQSVHQIILRDASDAVLRGDHAGLRAAAASANLFAVAVMSAALAGAVLFGGELLSLFGPAFGDGQACLILLILAQLIRAIGGPAIQILMIAGKQHLGLKVHLAAIVMLGLANAALVPVYGLSGAGGAVVATMLVWTIWLSRLARQATGVPISALALVGGRG